MKNDAPPRLDYPLPSNVPNRPEENVPILDLVQSAHSRRSYVKQDKIVNLAVKAFRENGRGITYHDLLDSKIAQSKEKAQRKLKRLRSSGVMFTIGRTSPQEYYPACIKAEIVEHRKKKAPTRGTGVRRFGGHPLVEALEQQKANVFMQTLLSLGSAPLCMHKIHLFVTLDRQLYHDYAHSTPGPVNKGKRHEENIGASHVEYVLSPNGSTEMNVACSQNPFRIETDDDILLLFAFLGQVRDRLLYIVSDPRGRMVPEVDNWILKRCDINRDVSIGMAAQLTLPDIQLVHAGRVFRAYVKSLGDSAVFRGEESPAPNAPIIEALDTIRSPSSISFDAKLSRLESKIDELAALIRGTQQ